MPDLENNEGARRAPPLFGQPMPGRDGCRAPIPTFPDLEGRWGYTLTEAGNGAQDPQLYNFVVWPDAQHKKSKDTGREVSDLATLVERNYEDNRYLCPDGDFRDWGELWGSHKGETLVIAGAGPSLTRSLPLLYANRKRFRLMCVNRALRAFTAPEHHPDYYHVVERRGIVDWTHEIGEDGMPLEEFDLPETRLLATPQCDPRIARCFPGRAWWGYTGLGGLGHHPDVYRLSKIDVEATTTIANTLMIGWKLGFKTIILVGTDFAVESCVQLVKDEEQRDVWAHLPVRTYFDQPWEAGRVPPWCANPQPYIGIDGKTVLTTAMMIGCAQFLQAVCDLIQFEAGVEVVNATPRGILRWNNKPLEEALVDACGD